MIYEVTKENLILFFVCILLVWHLFDLINFFSYKFCRKKCSGKKCRNWQCKLYNECRIMHVQQHAMQILNAAGYELVIYEEQTVPLPEFIPEDAFPVDFVRTESRLHFNNEEEMLAWAGMIYKHYIEFINK